MEAGKSYESGHQTIQYYVIIKNGLLINIEGTILYYALFFWAAYFNNNFPSVMIRPLGLKGSSSD